uniref:Saposin B-type domain-containing protein n=1 Tax=Plectus sambesii TaxID=2011161 RepID=A0A914UY57_9BILA
MKAAFIVLLALVAVACAAPKKPHVKAGFLCNICEEAVQVIETYADEDQADIEKQVENLVCKPLGSSFE